MRPLRVVVAGSVDDGKSTLLGRLMHDAERLFTDEVAAVRKASADFNLAFFTDGLRAERERGITMDVAYRHLTLGAKRLLLADVPGHAELIHNMATGASTADAAVLLVDAERGLTSQTRRHLALLAALGVEHVIVCLNKMDAVGFSAERAAALEHDVRAATPSTVELQFIPLAALSGDNVVHPSQRLSWFEGPSLAQALQRLEVRSDGSQLRAVVQLASSDGWVSLHMKGGALEVGDVVIAAPDTAPLTVLERSPSSPTKLRLGTTLPRGTLLTRPKEAPQIGSTIPVVVAWISPTAVREDLKCIYVQHGRRIDGMLTQLTPSRLEPGSVGTGFLALQRDTWFDPSAVSRLTSVGLIVSPEGKTLAGVRVP